MKSMFKPVLVAALLATAGFSAFSGGSHGPDEGGMMGQGMHQSEGRMGHMNPEKMQAGMAKHQAELKTALKITAAQESDWTKFTTTMAPPADSMIKRPSREDMAKLTTPERIDKMKTMRTEQHAVMSAAMDQRADATKAFYATLSPEQKKVFDEKAMRQDHGRGDQKGHRDGKGGMMHPKKEAS
ncbi:Spy/CpxP family protein refolding chaperone [Rhodoferax sp. PAMC 29310]|uniref:Spy/CpxP family protein refolding chaperone n=1 Tax=Rhodoferax sp. PAMC 29310 TaxID=2822760 RepID=UPI001F0B36DF|nr:Spy/CpxP family protein refolding chaperone [Rhodoferax sp. PAMC 29310]